MSIDYFTRSWYCAASSSVPVSPGSVSFMTIIQLACGSVLTAARNFTGVTLIDMTNAEPQLGRTVVLDGGLVDRIGPSEAVDIPPGALVIRGQDHWLIPGLWDMHVHAAWKGLDEIFAPLFVANGVTGLR